MHLEQQNDVELVFYGPWKPSNSSEAQRNCRKSESDSHVNPRTLICWVE